MNPILKGGLLIGAACAIWMFVVGFTGWYKDPSMANLFFLVVPIEIVGLMWTLRRTADAGRSYAGQVVAGTLAALTAAVIIFCSSLIFTLVAFPTFFADVEPVRRLAMKSMGMNDSDINAAIRAMTPFGEAFQGAMYTVLTGIVVSAVIAIWVRAKGTEPSHQRVDLA